MEITTEILKEVFDESYDDSRTNNLSRSEMFNVFCYLFAQDDDEIYLTRKQLEDFYFIFDEKLPHDWSHKACHTFRGKKILVK